MNYSRLGLRALNEYRRVSPLTYLGLRYCLSATATQGDRWAREIAPEVLRRQDEPSYLTCRQYKETRENGSLIYRALHFPGANEALAESALLRACAEQGGRFSPAEDVFSYHLAPPYSTEGVFVPYFKLFAARHEAIGKACRRCSTDIVIYADIKRFYPSVKYALAKRAWQDACCTSGLEAEFRRLGEHLLEVSQEVGEGLLVGPMFSHMLGNLVLAGFDDQMRTRFPGRFFRYVDDIALVIPAQEQKIALAFVRERLKRLGLELNPKKFCHLSAREWIRGAPHQGGDYSGMDESGTDVGWMRLVDQIKCFLILNPGSEAELARAFRDEGVRIPLPRYASAIEESGYGARFVRRAEKLEFRRMVRGLSVQRLVGEVRTAGAIYRKDFDEAWEAYAKAEKMQQKWLISRLRYGLGRLVSIAPGGDLGTIAALLAGRREFAEFQAVFDALTTRDVSRLVRFSGKVNAAAGQALATMGKPVRCVPATWSRESVEGYVTLLLLGANLHPEPPTWVRRRTAVRVVAGEVEARDWHEAGTPFLRELAALAGKPSLEKHRSLLQAPLDPDERWVLFADELQGVNS